MAASDGETAAEEYDGGLAASGADGTSGGDPDSRGVYAISVAAELVGTGQQNIRQYERKGLLTPDRTDGGTRRYSESDLATLRRIGVLLDEGLNLAGVKLVLELEAENRGLSEDNRGLVEHNEELREDNRGLTEHNEELRADNRGLRKDLKRARGDG
ncbi:MerR family transcriptional regulator [Arthrobacter sp. TS-15]|uniref:MerR family transcriptional regulator n=1 Tax=Arthrobacter sp. TS-15 TaxID=2510797 RepID=UPI00115CB312|nr:MerR family transcriptional regulator [Arthrobacter sp. TS-15]TQS90029.1 MerR family transcriptional regulator [Arthrobacter sp. TS-15]